MLLLTPDAVLRADVKVANVKVCVVLGVIPWLASQSKVGRVYESFT